MLKFINSIRLNSTTFLGILALGTLVSQSAVAAPVGIDSLNYSRRSATSSSGSVCDKDGNNCSTKRYGTGTNIELNGFEVDSKDYSILQLVDKVKFQRRKNNNVSGVKHIYFLETGDSNSIESSAIFTMEEAVRSDFINGGTDNVFANSGGVNLNNIERVDFIINSGLIVEEEYVNDAGFLLLERGGNDPFKIAAITSIDANGNPDGFGDLIDVPKSTWGESDINIKTSVFQNQADWNDPRLTASLGNQNINGIFISIASLGIEAEETIYGYAVFPGDITSSNDLVGLSDFPKNTSSDSGKGGLDLISSGGLFIPEDTPPTSVFKPASAVDDDVSTDEDTSVSGNVLTNDIGENLVVTTTGQKTLDSGASVTINSDGTFTYDPSGSFESLNSGEFKSDTFIYTMKDGNNNSSSATVKVTINGAPDNPIAEDDSFRMDEDTSKRIHVLRNDSDPNSSKETLRVVQINDTPVGLNDTYTLQSGAILTVKEVGRDNKSNNGDYTLQYDPTTSNSLNLLNEGENTTETFTYTVSDPEGNTDQGSVTITVDGVTDTYAD
jgi:VCBS repeat-containing protein